MEWRTYSLDSPLSWKNVICGGHLTSLVELQMSEWGIKDLSWYSVCKPGFGAALSHSIIIAELNKSASLPLQDSDMQPWKLAKDRLEIQSLSATEKCLSVHWLEISDRQITWIWVLLYLGRILRKAFIQRSVLRPIYLRHTCVQVVYYFKFINFHRTRSGNFFLERARSEILWAWRT